MPIVQTAKVDTYLLSICLHFNYHLLERKKTPTPIINARFFWRNFLCNFYWCHTQSLFYSFYSTFLYSRYITRYTFLHIGLQSSRFTMHWYFFIIMEIEYGVGWLLMTPRLNWVLGSIQWTNTFWTKELLKNITCGLIATTQFLDNVFIFASSKYWHLFFIVSIFWYFRSYLLVHWISKNTQLGWVCIYIHATRLKKSKRTEVKIHMKKKIGT